MTSVTLVSTADDGECGIGTYTGSLISDMDGEVDVTHVTVPLRSKNPLPYITNAVRAGRSSDDVIHVQHEYGIFGPKSIWSWLFFPVLYFVAFLRNTPVVLTLHSAWNRETIDPPLALLKRVYVKLNNLLLVAGASYLILLSENCKDRFEESVPLRRYEMMSHGVQTETVSMNTSDAKRVFGYDSTETVVVVPGYIRPEKGQDVFVKIADRAPEYEFLIAGGVQADEDEEFLREVERTAPENVQITGMLDDSRFNAAFNAADVAVLPYRDVTQSGIFNWCVAYEVPTVVSDELYFRRLNEQWDCVSLFDVEDPESATMQIQDLLSNEERRMKIAEGMRNYGKASSMETVIEKHIWIYEAVDTSDRRHFDQVETA
ncbi:glycosyltransferase (plasmid) [Haladaptatus sp. SPP-AMP-3]|uniref:glycosyltransferase n=1 Tax=Haladaptatus sp. SPP-AMP-3 TaxID=3121295 RepID=UPI003C2F929E